MIYHPTISCHLRAPYHERGAVRIEGLAGWVMLQFGVEAAFDKIQSTAMTEDILGLRAWMRDAWNDCGGTVTP